MTKEKGRLSLIITSLITLLTLGLAPMSVGATELVPPTDGTNTPVTQTCNPCSGGSRTETQTRLCPEYACKYPSPTPGPSPTPTPEPEATPEQTQTEVEDFQQQGNSILQQMRDKENHDQNHTQGTSTQTAADRQKHCEQLQTMVNKQIANFSSNAQSHLTVFNSVYTKVQAFAASKNVTSTDYQNLITTANTDQANATQAVAALKSVAVTIDCTQSNPASSLATIKAAVDSTRTALQAYQKAISAVISNLESTVGKQQ